MNIEVRQQIDFATHYLISSCKKLQDKYKDLIYESFKECSKLRAEQAAKLDEILKDTSNTSQDNLLSFMRFLDTMQWDSLIR